MESKPLNEIQSFEVKTDKVGKIVSPSTTDKAWQDYVEPVFDVLGKIPESLGSFFSDYQRPLITLGLILGAIVTVKITLAVLDAIDDIPLLGPISQLIGLGYSIWFIYRYLWKASNRQELAQELDALKDQIFGRHE